MPRNPFTHQAVDKAAMQLREDSRWGVRSCIHTLSPPALLQGRCCGPCTSDAGFPLEGQHAPYGAVNAEHARRSSHLHARRSSHLRWICPTLLFLHNCFPSRHADIFTFIARLPQVTAWHGLPHPCAYHIWHFLNATFPGLRCNMRKDGWSLVGCGGSWSDLSAQWDICAYSLFAHHFRLPKFSSGAIPRSAHSHQRSTSPERERQHSSMGSARVHRSRTTTMGKLYQQWHLLCIPNLPT